MKGFGKTILLLAGVILLLGMGGTLWLNASTATMRGEAEFVGRQSCAACHAEQMESYAGSHHDLAMQEPNAQTVLGDFSDTTFTDQDGTKSRFFMQDGKYFVHTRGADGQMQDFPVIYTFGADPLQQYLLETENGRLQSFTVAWDVNEKRWYSLYEDREVEPNNWLHWSQRGQNWNSNCAECHSTDLHKNYNLETDSFSTRYSEIDVSCEACHGPASRHVAWADAGGLAKWWAGYSKDDKGLALKLRDEKRAWGFDAQGQPTLLHSANRDPAIEVETCAHCHARRGESSLDFAHGGNLLDHYVPQLLQENIYHPDGQILDEVYVYGSFAQSRMYHKGVRCSDCHDPHSLKLKRVGNQLCVSCHAPGKYDTTQHHFHEYESTGASCVACHMPSKTYMGIDPRRDHSLRIPRPDLSLKIGTPNACNQCHTDRDAQWATDAVKQWYGTQRSDELHYGQVFRAAWSGDLAAEPALRELMSNKDLPAFVRASAANTALGYLTPRVLGAAVSLREESAAVLRREAAILLSVLSPEQRKEYLLPMLSDPVRAVRHAAAMGLMNLPPNSLGNEQKSVLQEVLNDYNATLLAHADNVGGRLRLAGFYESVGKQEDAAAAYAAAVKMDELNLDAKVAYAELLIRMNKDEQAEQLLREVTQQEKPTEVPAEMWQRAQGTVVYQLGLLIASDPKRLEEASGYLEQASRMIPDVPRVLYNLGEVYVQRGKLDEAERVLLQALRAAGNEPDLLAALARLKIAQKQYGRAEAYANQLLPLDPQRAQQLLQQMQGSP